MQERLSKKTYTLLTSTTMPRKGTTISKKQLKKNAEAQKKADARKAAAKEDEPKKADARTAETKPPPKKKKKAKRHKSKYDDDTMDVRQDINFTAAQTNATITKLLSQFVATEVAFASTLGSKPAVSKLLQQFDSGVSFKTIVTNACTPDNFKQYFCQFNIRNVRAQCAEFKRALRSKSNSIAFYKFVLLCKRTNLKEGTTTKPTLSMKFTQKNKDVLNELFFRAKLKYPGHQAGLDNAFYNALQQEQNDCRDDAIEYKMCIATFQQMFIDTWATFLCANTSAGNIILSWIQHIEKQSGYDHTALTAQIKECNDAWKNSIFDTDLSTRKRPHPTLTGFAIV